MEPQIWQSDYAPQKWPILGAKKMKMTTKIFFVPRIHMDMDILQKKRVQIGQFWPPQPHLQSTPPYMGLPPCAIFHNPDDREI